MYLPLSRKLPLRDSTAWGRFSSIQSLPRVYGTATLLPVPYDDSGRLFLVADHVIKSVNNVTVDSKDITTYKWFHRTDATGKMVAFIELQTAVTIGTSDIAVNIDGMLNPVTGLLMVNPADVVHDLLQWATGQTININRFAVFASECQREGLEVHGVLNSAEVTIRTALDNILNSCGCSWSSSAEDFGVIQTKE